LWQGREALTALGDTVSGFVMMMTRRWILRLLTCVLRYDLRALSVKVERDVRAA